MQNKKFNLFITSDDVHNFGNSYSISKPFLYFIITCSIISIFFAFFGFYYIFISSTPSSKDFIASGNNVDQLEFAHHLVHAKNNSDFETSFITSNFSEKHVGIDINGSTGTKIYSPLKGKVIYEGFDKKLGNVIIIYHDNRYITKYMHNKKNFVKFGDIVNPGKLIAEMGNSGSSVKNEGIHLHFELWKNGKPVNPGEFITNLKSVDTEFVSNNN